MSAYNDLHEDMMDDVSTDSDHITNGNPHRRPPILVNQHPDERLRHGLNTNTQKHLIVHRVVCGRDRVVGEDHSTHHAEADYFDIPRMLATDTRASTLRGQKPIENLDDHLEDHPEYLVVVVRVYSCRQYHERTRKLFQRTPSNVGRQAFAQLRPWLFQLEEDGPPATSGSESVQISESLNEALSALVFENEPFLGTWDDSKNLSAPYHYFYHFRGILRQKHLDDLDPTDSAELVEVLDYIEKSQERLFQAVDEFFNSEKVRYDFFEMLFVRNDVVVTLQDNMPRALVVEQVRLDRITGRTMIALDCWTWAYDGSFRKIKQSIKVPWPAPNAEIISMRDLVAWPLRLDKSDLKDRLLKRGREVWACRHRKLVCYNAPTPTIFELQITNPKYMIDYRTYHQIHPGKLPQALATEAEMKDAGVDMDVDEPPSDIFCILQPATMLGYAFHDKKWRTLSMEYIVEVPWNKEAFNRLVLTSTKKETIKALVMVHLKTIKNVDVVENKGNGLIILLHGSPGTGKTLTAESVAEIAEKPLYRVTCGDVGTNAESVERYMESVLLIGTIWECVVLLDEADVFLEERQVTDLQRNALVSVFLRVLEYYEGILILTTNRVGTFDEAFKSRVQLAVHYPALNEDGRFDIWHNFINVLKEKNVDMNFENLNRKVAMLARTPLNGRQIRNCLWTAAQVAKYKNERLDYSHLEQVVEISRDFEEYLVRTHDGHTDEENAQAQGLRNS